MAIELEVKLKAMLWDVPDNQRAEIVGKILTDPVDYFKNDDLVFIKALNSLGWYELIRLVGKQNLVALLTDGAIQKLFPVQRRTYYTNARRLLYKYTISPSGQNS
ncbi:MAG: hypothetical protein WCP85_06600 [Mariniphaga sp.]